MNPAAHQRLWPSVHVETNLAFHFRRGNALDFQRTVLRFGELVPGLLLGFGSNGLGLELGFGPYGISLGLQRLFARLDSRLDALDAMVASSATPRCYERRDASSFPRRRLLMPW